MNIITDPKLLDETNILVTLEDTYDGFNSISIKISPRNQQGLQKLVQALNTIINS